LGKKDKELHIRFDERHWSIITEISEALGVSKSEAVRTALRVVESLAARYNLPIKFFFAPTEVVERYLRDLIREIKKELSSTE